jgi:hypothetical protein
MAGRVCRHWGWSNSLGWYEDFSLLAAVDPSGVVTGFCFAAASTAEQQLAETFFAVRPQPNERLISVGSASSMAYVADKGFEGSLNHKREKAHLWKESSTLLRITIQMIALLERTRLPPP